VDAGTDPEKAADEAYRILGTVSLRDCDPKLSDLSYVERQIHDTLAETMPDAGIPDFDERLCLFDGKGRMAGDLSGIDWEDWTKVYLDNCISPVLTTIRIRLVSIWRPLPRWTSRR
jgi:hypothetical protein